MIAFMSDWGYDSYYVGVAKAVIRSITKEEIIDITHNIDHFNIRMGAHILLRASIDFPKDTIFLCVVDPSVGTSRKAIAMRTKNGMTFVGPDNGLFTFVAEKYGVHEIRELDNKKYYYGHSTTFHGRDIFAAAAAHLANGLELSRVGSLLMNYEVLRYRKSHIKGNSIIGEVAFYDHFGNMETNIPEQLLKAVNPNEGEKILIKYGKNEFGATFGKTYFDVRPGEILVHIDSSGFIEIAVNEGSAKSLIKAREGESIEIVPNKME